MRVTSDRRELHGQVRLAFSRALEDCVGDAKENAPVSVSRGMKLNSGDVQGGLRASIAAEPIREQGRSLVARFGSAVRYAMQREYGGTIVPVRAKVLAWIDPATGEKRFAKKVTQKPGGPRQGYRPWLRPAGDKFPRFMSEHLAAVSR